MSVSQTKLTLPQTVPLTVCEVPGDLSTKKVIGEATLKIVDGAVYTSVTITDKVYRDKVMGDDYSHYSIGPDSVSLVQDISKEVEDGRQTFKSFDISDFKPHFKTQ